MGKIRRALAAIAREPRPFARRHRVELLLGLDGLLALAIPNEVARVVAGALVAAAVVSILFTEEEHHRRGPLRRAAAERVAALASTFLDAKITVNDPLTASGWLARPTFHELAAASRAQTLDRVIIYPRDAYMFDAHFRELRTWFGSALGTRATLLSAEANATVDRVEHALDGISAAVRALAGQGSVYMDSALAANTAARSKTLDNMTPSRVALRQALETSDDGLQWLAKMTADDEAERP